MQRKFLPNEHVPRFDVKSTENLNNRHVSVIGLLVRRTRPLVMRCCHSEGARGVGKAGIFRSQTTNHSFSP